MSLSIRKRLKIFLYEFDPTTDPSPSSHSSRPPPVVMMVVVLPKDRALFLRPFRCVVVVSWSTGNSYPDQETTHRKDEEKDMGRMCVWGRLWKGSDRKDDAMIMMWLRMTQ